MPLGSWGFFRDVAVTLFNHLAKQEGREHLVSGCYKSGTQCTLPQICSECIQVWIMLLLTNGVSGTLLPAQNQWLSWPEQPVVNSPMPCRVQSSPSGFHLRKGCSEVAAEQVSLVSVLVFRVSLGISRVLVPP